MGLNVASRADRRGRVLMWLCKSGAVANLKNHGGTRAAADDVATERQGGAWHEKS